MMPSRFTLSFLTLALGAVSSAAMAVPYAFEARQEAMGGTGVASARYLSAPLYNPARLAFAKADDDVGILLPVVGAEVYDKDDLSGQVDDLSDSYDAYQNAYDANQANPREGANKQVISSQADSLIKISRIWADFFPANTSNQPI